MKKVVLFLCSMLGTLVFAQTANEYFQPLKFRNIGPFRGGRSVTASGVVGDPMTYYMGTTGGGLWKTTNAGGRWDNISDGFLKWVPWERFPFPRPTPILCIVEWGNMRHVG